MNSTRSTSILLVSSVAVTLLSVWIFYCVTIDGVYLRIPATYWEGSFRTEKDHYHPGEEVKVWIVATKYTPIQGNVTWQLVNEDTKEIIGFLTRPTLTGPGDVNELIRVATIPSYASPGRYRVKGNVSWRVNHFKTIGYLCLSNSFGVTVNGSQQ